MEGIDEKHDEINNKKTENAYKLFEGKVKKRIKYEKR